MEMLTSEGMIENLIAEGVGMIATLILITLLGGFLARIIHRHLFDRKWKDYRAVIAEDVLRVQKELEFKFSYLGLDLQKLVAQPAHEISEKDVVSYRHSLREVQKLLDKVNDFFERNHFALRPKDIDAGQKYLAEVAAQLRPVAFDNGGLIDNVDALIQGHLSGARPLGQAFPLHPDNGSGHDYLALSAAAMQKAVKDADTATWQILGEKLAETLKN